MTLARIIKINRSCKDISIEYWSKRKKKKRFNYFDIKTKQMYKKTSVVRRKMTNI